MQLNTKELSKRIGINFRTIENWRYLGKGPKFTVKLVGYKRHIVYPIAEVKKWEAARG